MGRVRQSLLYERSQLSGTGQFVTVPENRIKPCRHFSEISVRSNQMLWHAKGFELFSQPSGPILVLVRVRYERTVFVCSNIAQLIAFLLKSDQSLKGKSGVRQYHVNSHPSPVCLNAVGEKILGFKEFESLIPIYQVPKGRDVIRSPVLIVEVIGMFPNVQTDDWGPGIVGNSLH